MKKLVVVAGVLFLVLAVVAVGLGGVLYVEAQNKAPEYALKNNTAQDGFAGTDNIRSIAMEAETSMQMVMKSEVLSVLGESDTLTFPVKVSSEMTIDYENNAANITMTDATGNKTTIDMTLEEFNETLTIDQETLNNQFSGNPYTVTEVTEGDETSWVYTLTIDASHTEVVDNLKDIIASSFTEGLDSSESGVTLSKPEVTVSDDFAYVIEYVISQKTLLVKSQTESMQGEMILTTEYTGEVGNTLKQNGLDTKVTVTVTDVKAESTYVDIQLKQAQPTDLVHLWLHENL